MGCGPALDGSVGTDDLEAKLRRIQGGQLVQDVAILSSGTVRPPWRDTTHVAGVGVISRQAAVNKATREGSQ